MKWKRVDGAGDMIDARGRGGGRAAAGAGGLGVAGVIVVLLLTVLSGGEVDINSALNDAGYSVDAGSQPVQADPEQDTRAEFSNAVAVNVQDVWTELFQQAGEAYPRTKVVRYSRGVSTRCGAATSAVGPFYCPADTYVYLDMSFYDDMRRQLGAEGDFAWAYVIAHEFGHHVQEVTGVFDAVARAEREDPGARGGAQGLAVRTELQADCYAGVWAKAAYEQGALEAGDLDEALGAAEAVGDDRIQSRAGAQVRPDSFTHGTAEQRRRWFRAGYDSGSPGSCDTFAPERV